MNDITWTDVSEFDEHERLAEEYWLQTAYELCEFLLAHSWYGMTVYVHGGVHNEQ